MPSINQAGFNLIKSFEGCELAAYTDPVGVLTIGYGHTGPDVKPGMTITQAQADTLLQNDLTGFEHCVNDAVSHDATPNQFAAMVSLAFNIGCGAFQGSSVLREFNLGNLSAAAQAFGMWVYGDPDQPPLPGLVRRREAEAELFETA